MSRGKGSNWVRNIALAAAAEYLKRRTLIKVYRSFTSGFFSSHIVADA